ncbi:hypothetical protein V8C35DRAFT_103294 [Trichoderma chlorosporum]
MDWPGFNRELRLPHLPNFPIFMLPFHFGFACLAATMTATSFLSRTEIISRLKHILVSLQHDQESDNTNPITILLEALCQSLRWPDGRFEKKAIRQWCRKLQTIAPLEESTSVEDNPTPEPLSQNNTDDASPTQNTSETGECPTPDPRTQHNAPSDDASPTQNTSETGECPTANSTAQKSKKSRVLTSIGKLMKQSELFESWTKDPISFWNQLAQALQLPEGSRDERIKAFFEHAADQESKVEAQKLINRFDSIIAYLKFKEHDPSSSTVRLIKVKEYLEQIGVPPGREKLHFKLLFSGRRRLEFCHLLSKDDVDFGSYFPDGIHFNNISYGALFLDLDDKMWEDRHGWAYRLFNNTVQEFKSQDIIAKLNNSGATVAAQTLLQFRHAFIEPKNLKMAALSEERNSTAARSSTEADSDSTAASNYTSTDINWDSTETSSYLSTEADSVSTIASKRSSTKRACAQSDSDDTRVSKRVRAESDLDGARASKSAPSAVETNNNPVASERTHREGSLHMLVQTVELRGQNAATSETPITNLVSGPYTMQSNKKLSLNSVTIDTFLAQSHHTPNPPDMQNSRPGVIDGISNGLSLENEVNVCVFHASADLECGEEVICGLTQLDIDPFDRKPGCIYRPNGPNRLK